MFKVGDKVVCEDTFDGVGEVVNILYGPYPVIVKSPQREDFSFALDGRYFSDSPVTLKLVKEESIMEKITVTIQVTKSFEITRVERNLIADLSEGKRITTIKFIRAQYDLPLIEAKRICEAVWSTP